MYRAKYSHLLSVLHDAGSAVLAFSGGVDSSFLLKAMQQSGIRMLAVTAVSETMPEKDRLRAMSFASECGVEHIIIETDELKNDVFLNNTYDRCFYCKDELFKRLKSIAHERGFCHIFDGSNANDLNDYRPGRKAAKLHNVRSPLAECNLLKDEIRLLSRELGMTTWNQPSSPCLSSRIPYGQRITVEVLRRIDLAENFIRDLGIPEIRVRDHGDIARIEVNEYDMQKIMVYEVRIAIVRKLKSLGYKFISLDLEGYKSGSLNRIFDLKNTDGY